VKARGVLCELRDFGRDGSRRDLMNARVIALTVLRRRW
jgi:hypothetical protein